MYEVASSGCWLFREEVPCEYDSEGTSLNGGSASSGLGNRGEEWVVLADLRLSEICAADRRRL